MIFPLKPSRDEKIPIQIVSDLDALIARPIGFKFQGKSYQLKPVTTEAFLAVAQALSEINTLIKKDSSEVSQEDIYAAYYSLIQKLCNEFKLSDLKKMALPQIHALINLIVRHISGNTEPLMNDGEKKNPLNL